MKMLSSDNTMNESLLGVGTGAAAASGVVDELKNLNNYLILEAAGPSLAHSTTHSHCIPMSASFSLNTSLYLLVLLQCYCRLVTSAVF